MMKVFALVFGAVFGTAFGSALYDTFFGGDA